MKMVNVSFYRLDVKLRKGRDVSTCTDVPCKALLFIKHKLILENPEFF